MVDFAMGARTYWGAACHPSVHHLKLPPLVLKLVGLIFAYSRLKKVTKGIFEILFWG